MRSGPLVRVAAERLSLWYDWKTCRALRRTLDGYWLLMRSPPEPQVPFLGDGRAANLIGECKTHLYCNVHSSTRYCGSLESRYKGKSLLTVLVGLVGRDQIMLRGRIACAMQGYGCAPAGEPRWRCAVLNL